MASIQLPPLHSGQAKLARAVERYRFVAAVNGRRWGKTKFGAACALKKACEGPGRNVAWASNTYEQAEEGWSEVVSLASQIPALTIKESKRRVIIPGGGMLRCWSTEKADRLRGKGLHYLVLDECAMMQERVWTEVMRPMLTDHKGGALFITTPRGKNWLYRLWKRGESSRYPAWASFQFPSSSNPLLDPEEIEEARRDLPAGVFNQEFRAMFVDGAGQVFRFVDERSVLEVEGANRRFRHYMFADLAGHGDDFNSIAIVRGTDHGDIRQVYADRWNGTSVQVTIDRIVATARRYGPNINIGIDATGLGGNYAKDWLSPIGANGYSFTNEFKQSLVTNLTGLLEHGRISLLSPESCAAARAQSEELVDFQAERLPSGRYRYSAPQGLHDDTVVTIMGAAWLARQEMREDAVDTIASQVMR